MVLALELESLFGDSRTLVYLFAMDALATLKRWRASSWSQLDARVVRHPPALQRIASQVRPSEYPRSSKAALARNVRRRERRRAHAS